jgi:hypothetical protein
MQNPWDRERTWTPSEDVPASGSGWVWIIAVIVAVIGLFAVARGGGNTFVLASVGVSVFFMFMFLIHHRREVRRSEVARQLKRYDEAQRAQDEPMGMEPPQPGRDDAALRRVFDRFDLKVIEHGRRNHWEPKQISSLLEMARDFVDVPHASGLMRAKESAELDRHLDAALERGLLQFDIANNRKGDESRSARYYSDEPPF